jgi:hypothetical protein
VHATTLATLRVALLAGLVLELLAAVGTALVAVRLGLRLDSGQRILPQALAVLMLTPEVFLPLRRLTADFHAGAVGQAVLARLGGLTVTDRPRPAGGQRVPAGGERAPVGVVLEGVSLAAEGRSRPVLDEIDLGSTRGSGYASSMRAAQANRACSGWWRASSLFRRVGRAWKPGPGGGPPVGAGLGAAAPDGPGRDRPGQHHARPAWYRRAHRPRGPARGAGPRCAGRGGIRTPLRGRRRYPLGRHQERCRPRPSTWPARRAIGNRQGRPHPSSSSRSRATSTRSSSLPSAPASSSSRTTNCHKNPVKRADKTSGSSLARRAHRAGRARRAVRQPPISGQ